MNTRIEIDRAIRAAEALHDDHAGQVGSRRPDRQQSPRTLLDTHPGDTGLDLVSDEDRSRVYALVLGGSTSDYIRVHNMVGDVHDRKYGSVETDDDLSALEVLADDADEGDILIVFLRGWGRTIASGRKSTRQFEEMTALPRWPA